MTMRKKLALWGSFVAIAACLTLGPVKDARADACWDVWRAKLNAQSAKEWALVAQLKKTGDCSYLERLVEEDRVARAILRAVPCKNMTKNYGSDEGMRAKWSRYCKTNTQEAGNTSKEPTSGASSPPPTEKIGE